MKLGFVGVGKHATKMAAAFRECGAEVVAYERRRTGSANICINGDNCYQLESDATCYKCGRVWIGKLEAAKDFGARMPWQDMIASRNIDALIICAPPDVTTEVALACAKAGKRCVATKPLMLQAPPDNFSGHRQCVYVDLWRLYSPAWQALKAELSGKQIQSVHVDFYGNGPVRGFSGLLDYGPHALAFVADLLGDCVDLSCGTNGPGLFEIFRRPSAAHPGIVVTTGNGAIESRKRIIVEANGAPFVWEEKDGMQMLAADHRSNVVLCSNLASLALRTFCRAFLAAEPSDTLRISCKAMRVLMPLVQ